MLEKVKRLKFLLVFNQCKVRLFALKGCAEVVVDGASIALLKCNNYYLVHMQFGKRTFFLALNGIAVLLLLFYFIF